MIVLALFLVLGGSIGVLTEDRGFVWVQRLLNHPFLLGCAAALLFGFGLARLVERSRMRFPIQVLGILIAVVWGALGALVSWLYGTTPVEHVVAPGRAHQVVVEEGLDVIDLFWEITVEQRGGLLARRWEVGCISDDWNGLRGVAWRSDEVLVVDTYRGRSLIRIDPRDGRPTRDSDELWGCWGDRGLL